MTQLKAPPKTLAPEVPILAPLLVDAAALAALLDVSERQVHRLDDGGNLPAPIMLGRCKRWSVEEVRAWLASGAPPRSRWNLRTALASPREREQGR